MHLFFLERTDGSFSIQVLRKTIGKWVKFSAGSGGACSKPYLSFAKPSPLNAAALTSGQPSSAGSGMCEL